MSGIMLKYVSTEATNDIMMASAIYTIEKEIRRNFPQALISILTECTNSDIDLVFIQLNSRPWTVIFTDD